MTVLAEPRVLVLVEGPSDETAIRTLARRLGRDLHAEGVSIVSIGGATNIRAVLELLGVPRTGVRLAGLCDAREAPHFQRALEQAGLGAELDREKMERLGFFVCDRDLEDELIRTLGPHAVEEAFRRNGELESFRILQKQPAWRGQPAADQLHRFLRSQSRRRYTAIQWLVEALDLNRLPRPLDSLLAYVR